MRKTLFSLLVLMGFVLIFFGCGNSKSEIRLGIGSFDITPDGKNIIYTFRKSARMLVYKANIDGSNREVLVDGGGSMEYYNPRCSEDGKKIVFISSNSKSPDGPIWICDINGKGLEQFTDGNSMIIEAIFSLNNDSIYFTQAEEYENYSPMVRKAPHKFDIYSINLNDKTIVKKTNEAAYSIYNLSDVDSTRWLFNLNGEGSYFYNKNGSGKKMIVAINDTLRNSKMYFNPLMIDRNTIITSSSYDLVKINLATKMEKLLLLMSGSHFSTIRYNKKLGKIFFAKTNDVNTIHSVNLDGTGMLDIIIQ